MSNNFIELSIRLRTKISFVFRGAFCLADPYAVGVGHDGQRYLAAYQTSGPTAIPNFHWIYMPIASLKVMAMTDLKFEPKGNVKNDTRFQSISAAVWLPNLPGKAAK